MPVKQHILYTEGVYFITFTCCQWLNLIEITNGYDIVYKWFDYLKSKGHFIVGFQIMPNHIHVIIGFRDTGKSINTIVGNGKRFMAYEIVERLKRQQETAILEKLKDVVNISDRNRGKLHEVWEDSFDWKECSREMIVQKLDYMHDNPCSGKWKLVDSPVDYMHSSAKYYITGEQGIYPVTNYMELEDIDLTKVILQPGPSSPADETN